MIRMFFPSKRAADLGGNGGCGGMVSVVLISIVVLLALKLTGVA